MTGPIRVAALYRFATLEDPASFQRPLLDVCNANGIKGTILIAPEGINGTIAGTPEGIEAVEAHVRILPGCDQLEIKYADAATIPFYRMKVRVKREIVTLGLPDLDPAHNAGTRVMSHDWNAIIGDPETLLIDTRNDYESRIGSFEGAIAPPTRSFVEFPRWFQQHREELLAGKRRVAMFCTGGIRCEKSTAFLKAEGISEVFHLDGGILRYLEDVPQAESRWHGECFVFDERVAVGHGLTPGTHELCRACRMPVTLDDKLSPQFVEAVSCPACHSDRNDADRARYAERHRQVELNAKHGRGHIGVQPEK
jgi:UPF0176 protein